MASYDRHVRVEIDYTVGKKQKNVFFCFFLEYEGENSPRNKFSLFIPYCI